jgi:acetolactate synthase small subunit
MAVTVEVKYDLSETELKNTIYETELKNTIDKLATNYDGRPLDVSLSSRKFEFTDKLQAEEFIKQCEKIGLTVIVIIF